MNGLHDHNRTPHRRRRRQWPPALRAEIRRLRNAFPNLGKVKLYVLLEPWCERRGMVCPSVSTIGRLIANASDKMRLVPTRLTPKGKVKPRCRSRPKQRLGKGFCADYPGYCVAFDTVCALSGAPAATCSRPPTTPAALPWRSRSPATTASTPHASWRWSKPCSRGASSRYSRTMVPSSRVPLPTMPGRRGWRHFHTYPRSPKMTSSSSRSSSSYRRPLPHLPEEPENDPRE